MPSRLIPRLLVVFTRQLEILVTTPIQLRIKEVLEGCIYREAYTRGAYNWT